MSHMDVLIKIILSQYFTKSSCIAVVQDGLNGLNIETTTPLLWFTMNHTRNLFNHIGCHAIVVQVQDPVETFQKLELEIKLHPDRFNKRRYLFIHDSQTDNWINIFRTTELNYVTDLLVVLASNYTLWTHKYVGSQGSKPYMVDQWFSNNHSFLRNQNLFPDKLTNQMGRPLRVAMFSYEPYVIFGKFLIFELSICKNRLTNRKGRLKRVQVLGIRNEINGHPGRLPEYHFGSCDQRARLLGRSLEQLVWDWDDG